MKSFLVAAGAACAAAQTLVTVKDEFVHSGYAAKDAVLTFSAAMPWRNYDKLEAELLKRSDPRSPLFTEWLSMEQVRAMTSTDPATVAEVSAFLAAKGAKCEVFPHSLKCSASVASVEKMLNTRVHAFKQTTRSNKLVHRVHPDEDYTFPQELKGKVQFFTNLADFPTVKRRNGKAHGFGLDKAGNLRKVDLARGLQGGTDALITVETLNKFYNGAGVAGAKASTQAPAEFQADPGFSQSDTKIMATESGLPVWTVSKTIGPKPTGGDLEASLDEQYMGGVGQGNDNWYWTEADWMLEWTEALQKTGATIPSVFSVSWGWSEADQCTIDPAGPCAKNPKASAAYVATCNQGFAAVTATGVSFLISSGDSGAHGRTDGSCAKPKTLPDWPTASPWITAVGASQLVNFTKATAPTSPICKKPVSGTECPETGTEVVCSPATGALIASGGGFSNVAARPPYQDAAVKAYIAMNGVVPPAKDYNATGRGYPDVAALGHNYVIWAGGQPTLVDGTSCSAPVFGAVVALANAARSVAGKKPIGFLNPTLYTLSADNFQDITSGDNTCTEDGCTPGCTGFKAAPGWDATTGFGTPNIAKFVAAIAAA